MIDKVEVYIIQALDYPGDTDGYIECPGNDVLEWYYPKYGKDDPEDKFDIWVSSQLPEGTKRILLEWMW